VAEPLLPAPDAGLGLARLGHDRGGADAIAAEKHDPRPPDVLLRAFRIHRDGAQPLAVARRQGEGDSSAHPVDSHRNALSGIPEPDSFDPNYPLDPAA